MQQSKQQSNMFGTIQGRGLAALRPSRSMLRRRMLSTSQPVESKIVYTLTDEAPMLATYSFLPIVQRFAKSAGVEVETSDISVASRILAQFPDQNQTDNLGALGVLAKTPDANMIKLPNVSASVPQLIGAIAELQSQGYTLPDFTQEPTTDAERDAAARYANVLGSSVNPVLREGNSDRRVAAPVKEFAMKNPKMLGKWSKDCRTHVAHMATGDFYSSEQSAIFPSEGSVTIEHVDSKGAVTVLRESVALEANEVVDAAVLSVASLREYFETEISNAKQQDILLSLHMKATMMKISDPIIFGHAVTVYFKDVFEKHEALFSDLGVNVNNGLGHLYEKIATLPEAQRQEIEHDIAACYVSRPRLAMVDSRRGITNLHVPSDVIIDASMPVVVRDSGQMWNLDDALEDTKCLIPDRCYAGIYQAVFDFCREHGEFDPSTMGSVANVGLMAKKAEEYGSHDKTFEIASDGVVRVTADTGEQVFEHAVATGDIWRMCQTKDAPIRDWVRLAVSRARATEATTIFWLNPNRAHDANLKMLVEQYLTDYDTAGLDLTIQSPVDAIKHTMANAKAGKDTVSVTGNVLRDYLTDLFPILELGTSAKMLSIVPLLAGGGLFETGAGGSAPKHVQQFVEENHLRWDSLGEYLALAVSLEHLADTTGNDNTKVLSQALTKATSMLLENNKSPSRKVNELDNRGSNFYIALYWAQAMAESDSSFAPLAKALTENETQIVQELIDCQGVAVDIGGYYKPDGDKVAKAMCPSPTLNAILAN